MTGFHPNTASAKLSILDKQREEGGGLSLSQSDRLVPHPVIVVFWTLRLFHRVVVSTDQAQRSIAGLVTSNQIRSVPVPFSSQSASSSSSSRRSALFRTRIEHTSAQRPQTRRAALSLPLLPLIIITMIQSYFNGLLRSSPLLPVRPLVFVRPLLIHRLPAASFSTTTSFANAAPGVVSSS